MPATDFKTALDNFLDAAEKLAEVAGHDLAQSLVSKIFEKGGGAGKARRAATPGQPKAARAPKGKSTRWVLDKTVRGPVPDFVLEMTNISVPKGAKKELLARYHDGAVFEAGKPLPTPKHTTGKLDLAPPAEAAKTVAAKESEPAKAKPPRVRKVKKAS